MDTRRGIVRHGVGGEHPSLGVLMPGRVLDVPVAAWSDELFAPAAEAPAAGLAPLPVVDDEMIAGLDTRIAAAEAAIAGVGADVAQAERIVARVPAVQAAMEELRAVSRRIRERQTAIERRRAEIVAELDAMRRDLATDMLAAEAGARALAAVLAGPMPASPPMAFQAPVGEPIAPDPEGVVEGQ